MGVVPARGFLCVFPEILLYDSSPCLQGHGLAPTEAAFPERKKDGSLSAEWELCHWSSHFHFIIFPLANQKIIPPPNEKKVEIFLLKNFPADLYISWNRLALAESLHWKEHLDCVGKGLVGVGRDTPTL